MGTASPIIVAMTDHAVVIAGGGPTGLMLAGELALAYVSDVWRARSAKPDLLEECHEIVHQILFHDLPVVPARDRVEVDIERPARGRNHFAISGLHGPGQLVPRVVERLHELHVVVRVSVSIGDSSRVWAGPRFNPWCYRVASGRSLVLGVAKRG